MRECDHDEPCGTLGNHLLLESAILSELEDIKKQLADLQKVLEVFRQVNGFFSVGKWLAVFIIGLASLIGGGAVIMTAVRAWLKG